MKTMSISEFKAQALRAIDQVAKNREPLVITRHGRPLAEVVPYPYSSDVAAPGRLADSLVFEEDIVTPLGSDMWEVTR